jgi:hypothetical protein
MNGRLNFEITLIRIPVLAHPNPKPYLCGFIMPGAPVFLHHNWDVTCLDYIRLRQHYEAALTLWDHVILPSKGALANSPPAVLEMKNKALEERNAAEERMILHQRTCPICIPR